MLLAWLFPVLLLAGGVLFVIHQKTKAKRTAIRPVRQSASIPSEPEMYELKPAFPVKASLRIWYTDREGQNTERTVDVREVGAGIIDNTLLGYCRLRKEQRTFYVHRINQCVDIETGELIGDAYQYLWDKYEQSPEYKLGEFANNQYDALRILLYIGKADGALRAKEREIIRSTCHSLMNDSSITDAMIDNMFKDIQLMTEPAFKLAVGRLAKQSASIQKIVFDAAEKMIASDKKIHPTEQVALDYMRKRWSA